MILPFIIISLIATGQPYKLSGYVRDVSNGENIIDALIINYNSQTIKNSNEFGFFEIKGQLGDSIEINKMGYKLESILINSHSIDTIVLLTPLLIEEVVIRGFREGRFNSYSSKVSLTPIEIDGLSYIAGESDPMIALQFIPGVVNTREGMSGVVVRGGLPDQNLIMVDGVRVYNYTHLFGFLSFINADNVNQLSFYKSGIPEQFGGMASSVIDINLKDGNYEDVEGKYSIGLISSKIFYTRPIIKNKLSFLGGLRSSYLELLTLPRRIQYNAGNREDFGSLGLYDLTLKSRYKISENSEFTTTYINTYDYHLLKDKIGNRENIRTRKWRNEILGFQYNRPFGNSTYFTLSGGRYTYDFNYSEENLYESISETESGKSSIEEYTLNLKLDHGFGQNINFRLGAQFFTTDVSTFEYSEKNETSEVTAQVPQQRNSELSFYTSLSREKSSHYFRAGARLSYINKTVNMNLKLLPRFQFRKIFGKLGLEFSYDANYQDLFQINPIALDAPVELWTSSQDKTAISKQLSFSTTLNLNDNTSFMASLFSKYIDSIVESSRVFQDFNIELAGLQEYILDDGNINARGLEFSAQYKSVKIDCGLSFTITHSNTSFTEINDNKEFRTSYNRERSFAFNIGYKLSPRIRLNLNGLMQSGQPITLPVNSYFTSLNSQEFIYGDRNNGTYPNYQRVDISSRLKLSETTIFSISIYNVFNFRNPFHILLETKTSDGVFISTNYEDQVLFGILPTIAYEKTF